MGKELRVAIDKEWGICHQPSYLGCSKDGKGANSLVYLMRERFLAIPSSTEIKIPEIYQLCETLKAVTLTALILLHLEMSGKSLMPMIS